MEPIPNSPGPDQSIGQEQELSPEWKEMIRGGIQDAIGLYQIDPEYRSITLSPADLSAGEDGRNPDELSGLERAFAKKALMFELFSQSDEDFETFDPDPVELNPEEEYEYEIEGSEQKAKVKICQTPHSQEFDMFLHEVTFPDGVIDYQVAPRSYRF